MKYQSKRNGKVYVVVDEFQKGGKTVNLTLEAEDGTQTVVTTSTLKKNYTPVEEASDVAPAQEKAPEKPAKKEKKAEKQTSKKSEKPAKEKKERVDKTAVFDAITEFVDELLKDSKLSYKTYPSKRIIGFVTNKIVLRVRVISENSANITTRYDDIWSEVALILGSKEVRHPYYVSTKFEGDLRKALTDIVKFLAGLAPADDKKTKSTKKEKGEN